jgi:hypothetical protein
MHGTTDNPHHIIRRPLKGFASGMWYWVEYDGLPLIARTKSPEHDACRALVAKGHTGLMETRDGIRSYPLLIINDIEKAARLTVSENASHGPRVVSFRPFPASALRGADLPTWDDEAAA